MQAHKIKEIILEVNKLVKELLLEETYKRIAFQELLRQRLSQLLVNGEDNISATPHISTPSKTAEIKMPEDGLIRLAKDLLVDKNTLDEIVAFHNQKLTITLPISAKLPDRKKRQLYSNLYLLFKSYIQNSKEVSYDELKESLSEYGIRDESRQLSTDLKNYKPFINIFPDSNGNIIVMITEVGRREGIEIVKKIRRGEL